MKKNKIFLPLCSVLLSCTLFFACTGSGNNGTSTTTGDKTEKPVVDKPKSETPVAEAPKTETPRPVTETPSADPSNTDGAPAKPSEASSAAEKAAQPEPGKSEDGKCYYVEYKGLAKIKSIADAPPEADNCPDAVLVEFSFGPINTSDVKNYRYTLFKDDSQYLTIHSGMNPSKAWLARTGIQEGTILTCSRKEIVQGDCSKVIFDFSEIDIDPKERCK